MPDISAPEDFDTTYARVLRSAKAEYVTTEDQVSSIEQFGAARIRGEGWPGWPINLGSDEPVFETYVVGNAEVTATSDNQPFVDAWSPLVAWLNHTVRGELARYDLRIDGDAYVTASLSAAAVLEGIAHMDDDSFVPADSVQVVAIIGQHVGPRVATGRLDVPAVRPMGQVVVDDQIIDAFAADQIDHCQAAADEIVVFPQFGQLHAGPATEHLAAFESRQLLVLRGTIALPRLGEPVE